MKLVRQLPNAMTCGNLLCGCLGIVQVFEGSLTNASYLIFLAVLLDFGDGFVARLVKATSPIGKELDSLADCVSFGVLPALILFAFLRLDSQAITRIDSMGDVLRLVPAEIQSALSAKGETQGREYVAFLLAIFSAIRLAKFNIDPRQSDSFIGIPTPANAIVIASFPLILAFQPAFTITILLSPYFLISYCVIMSYLLIAELPLFSLKFKTFSWTENRIKYFFLLISVILLLFLQFMAIPLIIIVYILLSVLLSID